MESDLQITVKGFEEVAANKFGHAVINAIKALTCVPSAESGTVLSREVRA